MICSTMFSRAAVSVGLPLLLLMFCPTDGTVIHGTTALAPTHAGPVSCVPFGEGGPDFFQPQNYADFVRCHNEQYAANDKTRPIHVLFEASAKTEFGAAFGLMKALASQKEKYKVTYLSSGGTFVRRRTSSAEGGCGEDSKDCSHATILLGPEERPGEHDKVLYEAAFPPKKNEELRKAGINVVLKSMLTLLPQEMVGSMLDQGIRLSEPIPEDVSEFSNEKIWIQTLADLPPVDFVVADCYGAPRSVKLLMGRAQVPGASWCGNFGNVGMALGDLASTGGVWPMINTQLAARRTEDPRFQDAELTPVFSAHFLGWGAEAEQPWDFLALEPLDTVGPTREVSFGTNNSVYDGRLEVVVEELINSRMKVPISLVSNLPTAATAVVHQRATGADQELPEIKAIHAKMDELRATRLIYIAFGSQGFTFKKAAYKKIIEEAAAVPSAVVFFVIPPAADWEDSPAYPYQTDSWRTDYYSATVAGEALTLPENVLLSTWAPQKAIFERFGGPNTVFLTHGGAGSLSEGIANNIALACFPFKDDQPSNCTSTADKGLGVDLRPFSGRMILDDETIEMPGGPWLRPFIPPPSKDVFEADATPDAGKTIQARIEYIFLHAQKFSAALAKASDGLKAGAYAQDAVIGAFEETIDKQLRLYKEMGLFDGGRASSSTAESSCTGEDNNMIKRRRAGWFGCSDSSCFGWLNWFSGHPARHVSAFTPDSSEQHIGFLL